MTNNENTVLINIQLKDYSNESNSTPKDKELFVYNDMVKLGDGKTTAESLKALPAETIDWDNVIKKPDMLKGQGQYSIVENIAATPLNNSVEVGIQATDKVNTYKFSGNISLNIALQQINYLKELEINNENYQVISYDIDLNDATIVLSKEINIELDETKKYQVIFKGFNVNNQTKAAYSHVEGSENNIKASQAKYSHVEGHGHEINTNIYCCHIEGEYSDINNINYVHVVGNGKKNEYEQIERSNAHTLDWDGNAWFSGNVKVGGKHYSNAETLATENFVKTYIPLSKGEGEDSIQTINSQAIGDNSFAYGDNVIAGCKGYYIKSIDIENKKIYLSNEKVEPVISTENNTDTSFTTPNYAINDTFSIIAKIGEYRNHFNLCSNIISISNNVIEYDKELPFTEIYADPNYFASPAFFVTTKPLVGEINLFGSNFVEGSNSIAASSFSHAEGYGSIASGNFAHAEGRETIAVYAAHAEGQDTRALGHQSHTEGYNTETTGSRAHAEGISTIASADSAHAEGYCTQATGLYSHAEGEGAKAQEQGSHAEGKDSIASGSYSHAEGYYTQANGKNSHSEGQSTIANGDNSHAEGFNNSAAGNYSHVEGVNNTITSVHSHAEGNGNKIYSANSHVEGSGNIINSGTGNHVIGQSNTILQGSSGINDIGGAYNKIYGENNFVRGQQNVVNGNRNVVFGMYNKEINGNDYFIIGNGTEASRSNAVVIDKNGNLWIKGDIKYGGNEYNSTEVKNLQTIIADLTNRIEALENK